MCAWHAKLCDPSFRNEYRTLYKVLDKNVLSKTVKKRKGFPYSIPNVGLGADPGVQAVSRQVTVSRPPGGRLPLLSARPAVTFPAAEHHRPLAGAKLYCLVTEAHRCEQLAQGCYAALPRVGFEPNALYQLRHTATHVDVAHFLHLYNCAATKSSRS